jgi:hypothetical protein
MNSSGFNPLARQPMKFNHEKATLADTAEVSRMCGAQVYEIDVWAD